MSEQSPRAWQIVLAHIERALRDGRLGPGDGLPSERDLAAELGVARSSVREALRALEVMGLLRTASGSGPQSGAILIATPGGGLSELMRLQVAAQSFPIADVVQTRLVLEETVAATLASDPARDTGDVHRVLDAMDAPALTAPEFLVLDARLHIALAEAAGNAVIAATMAGLRSSIESYVLDGAALITDWTEMADRLRAEHRALVAAIDAGDADGARALVRDHIIGYYQASGLVTA